MTVESHASAARGARHPAIRFCPTAGVELAATPIERSWLLDGAEPRTEAATLASDEHDTLAVFLWQTTRARYRWEHASDEVVTVLDGECFIVAEGAPADEGGERRLGAGDVAFFPRGRGRCGGCPSACERCPPWCGPCPGRRRG